MSAQQNTDYLMQVLNFTPQDLMMNRSGVISEGQKSNLKTRFKQQGGTAMKIFGIVILFSVLGFVRVASRNEHLIESLEALLRTNPIVLAIPAVFLAIWFLMMIVSFARSRRASFDNARLLNVSGTVRLKITETPPASAARLVMAAAGEDGRAYLVEMDKLKFYVDSATFQAFADGRPYRIYYLAHGRTPVLVSAEAIQQ